MKKLLSTLLPFVLAAAAFAQDAATTATAGAPAADSVAMLRLRSGAIHWGSIVEHDPDGLVFELLTHGGRVEVPWNLLDPRQEEELRQRFGYVDVSSEELMIDAERLILSEGQERIGVIVSREGANFILKEGGNIISIPKTRVTSVTKGLRVPALDIYSREEIYSQYEARAATGDAQSQHELAKTCERILDFQHAVEHYQAALTLDPTFNAEEIGFALERATAKAAQQEQIDYLRNVDILRKKKKFDEALAAAEAFGETFPNSPLQVDANKKREQVLRARDDATRDLVKRRWHYWMRRLARDGAKLNYQDALAYAQEGLSDDIQNKVLEDVQKRVSVDIQLEHVLAYWATRKKVRYENASYGLGTFLLGEDRAHAGTDPDKEAKKEPKTEKDAERAALEEKIKRFQRNQQLARRAQSRQDEAENYESFWNGFPPSNRAQWIRAYYVENSGDLELRPHPYIRPCPTCAGSGAREVIFTGGGQNNNGGTQLVKCETCQGVAIIRRVYYR
ncbi:MAG: hypothetical protein GY711_14285 [bacterium]|nr:hypothetical protein [bacterium]